MAADAPASPQSTQPGRKARSLRGLNAALRTRGELRGLCRAPSAKDRNLDPAYTGLKQLTAMLVAATLKLAGSSSRVLGPCRGVRRLVVGEEHHHSDQGGGRQKEVARRGHVAEAR